MKITSLNTGYFKLDGGAMFGIVPRRMWAKMNPPDDDNLCTWSLRVLLVETEGRKILVDTGMGNKQDAKFRSHFLPHGDESLLGALAGVGLLPEDITDVFLTHLHFDHCGGCLYRDEATGAVKITFPNATYWSNQRHYDWAIKPNAREKASFLAENFQPLLEQGRLRFLEVRQNIEFVPGFRVRFFYGHTEAMMVPVLESGGRTYIYCADALASHWHISMPFVMAFDIRPLKTLQEKEKMLTEAARKKQVLLFEHDPEIVGATVKVDDHGRIVLAEKTMMV